MNGTIKWGSTSLDPKAASENHLEYFNGLRAYTELEAMGLIEARPESGYYVSSAINRLQPPAFRKKPSMPRKVTLTDMVPSIVADMNDPKMRRSDRAVSLLTFCLTKRSPGYDSFTTQEIKTQLGYTLTEGVFELRRQLALRMLVWMDGVSAEETVITNGCSEARPWH